MLPERKAPSPTKVRWIDTKECLPRIWDKHGSEEVLAQIYTAEGHGYQLIASLNHAGIWVTGEDFTRLVEYAPGIVVCYWCFLPDGPAAYKDSEPCKHIWKSNEHGWLICEHCGADRNAE